MFVHNEAYAPGGDQLAAPIHTITGKQQKLRYRSHRTILRMRGMGKCCNASGVLPQADLLFMAARILTGFQNEFGAVLKLPELPEWLEIQKDLESDTWYLACELPAGCSVGDWNRAIRNNHVTVDLRHVAGLEAVREPGGVMLEVEAPEEAPIGITTIHALKEACRTNHYTIDGFVTWMFRRPASGRSCNDGSYLLPVSRQHYSCAC